jgi:hypothetical protein
VALKISQKYLPPSRTQQLRGELDQLAELAGAMQGVVPTAPPMEEGSTEGKACPVCFEAPDRVFSCLECENWVCGTCKSQVASCPNCREDWEVFPPKRNVAVERALARI